ncbi:MAG: response regulator [Candidatus Omnitrophica bacterium]|nr:response regulator [Candidatus Omnitrophota bacterium]
MNKQKSLKFLVIDDEEGIVDYTQKIYKKRGYAVFGAVDGLKGVEIFEKERPEITLIDVHMPLSPIDGVETLKRIKKIDNNAICIMVTRITERDKVDASKQLGAFAYLLKPLDIEDIDRVINEAREKHKL